MTYPGPKSEDDVQADPQQSHSREPDGAYVGRTSPDDAIDVEESGGERRARLEAEAAAEDPAGEDPAAEEAEGDDMQTYVGVMTGGGPEDGPVLTLTCPPSSDRDRVPTLRRAGAGGCYRWSGSEWQWDPDPDEAA
jgi:hypothetical protein